MRVRRFLVEDLSPAVVRVAGREAIHALRVLRLGVGAEVTLFDGQGREAIGRIDSVGPSWFEMAVTQRRQPGPAVVAPLVLAVAAPKGHRADWLVEKSAELGVRALWPLVSERGDVLPGEGKLVRWRRKAVEAAKQAGHAVTMAIAPPRTVAHVAAGVDPAQTHIFYGDPDRSTATLAAVLRDDRAAGIAEPHILICIGPEGGFTDAERRIMEDAGGRPVRIADAILRVETAAVAAAAIWATWAAESPRE